MADEIKNISVVERIVFWRIQTSKVGSQKFGDFPLGDVTQIKFDCYYHTLIQTPEGDEIGIKDPSGVVTIEFKELPDAFGAISELLATKLKEQLQ